MAAQSYRAALPVDNTYKKASSSLARVELRVDDLSASPIDLINLAETFDREIRQSPKINAERSAIRRETQCGDCEHSIPPRYRRHVGALGAAPCPSPALCPVPLASL